MSIRRTTVKAALESPSPCAEIRVMGWVRTRRDAKGFSFLELNDGSCLGNLQVIIDDTAEGADLVKSLGVGASVAVTGELVASPGKGQRYEVRAASDPRVVTRNISPAPSQSEPVMTGVWTRAKPSLAK